MQLTESPTRAQLTSAEGLTGEVKTGSCSDHVLNFEGYRAGKKCQDNKHQKSRFLEVSQGKRIRKKKNICSGGRDTQPRKMIWTGSEGRGTGMPKYSSR